MKVLLKEDVSNLGYAGEVMDVADGYGRNYLIPQGMAVKATPGVLTSAKVWRERAKVRLAELRKEHEALAERISGAKLVFYARAGDTGKLYGSVTTNDVVDALNKELGTNVDRRAVVGESLRQLGEHQVTVRLSRDYQPQVMVYIHPEGEEPVEVVEEEVVAEVEVEGETVEVEVAEIEAEVEEAAEVEAAIEVESVAEVEEAAEAEEVAEAEA
ncbi:MAG: 50S ribosomal protein L9 [Candidatus Promineifilaceae bacterium]